MLLIWVGLSVPTVECRGQVVRRPAQCLRQGGEGLRAPSARVDVVLQLAQGVSESRAFPAISIWVARNSAMRSEIARATAVQSSATSAPSSLVHPG